MSLEKTHEEHQGRNIRLSICNGIARIQHLDADNEPAGSLLNINEDGTLFSISADGTLISHFILDPEEGLRLEGEEIVNAASSR